MPPYHQLSYVAEVENCQTRHLSKIKQRAVPFAIGCIYTIMSRGWCYGHGSRFISRDPRVYGSMSKKLINMPDTILMFFYDLYQSDCLMKFSALTYY